MFNNIHNIQHKAILYLIYSSGLRVGDRVIIKVNDIADYRMLIHVVQGKGRKDRYTLEINISVWEYLYLMERL
ncbi:MAG: tyrosine-type recombinase/integrase [Firmicutes bacterium]|nr:tyrosine-type recombinase/integrase [Bacillota bacterium]